jgi:maleylpyruvate isomerase
MKFYTYYRSSAAYRVRIGLNLKGLEPEESYVHLRDGAQRSDDYLAVNPQGLVPALVDDDGAVLGQSLAILEYLDERYPEPALLPVDPVGRARVRQISYVIACDIHPIDNLKVLNYLATELAVDGEGRKTWYRHWVMQGLGAVEELLADSDQTGKYCHGDQPTIADLCLVPQIYNANRYDCDLSGFANILRINETCLALEAFAKAAPDIQPDAE